jgi:hypothetical protein
MQVIETTVFTFEELEDRAKENARDWWRGVEEFPWFDEYKDSITAFCGKFGIQVKNYCLSADYRASIDTDSMPSHFRGIKLKDIDREEMLTGFCADCALMYSFYDTFKQTGNAYHAFETALDSLLVALRKDIESTYEDEYIDEMLIANEFTFTESGRRFG